MAIRINQAMTGWWGRAREDDEKREEERGPGEREEPRGQVLQESPEPRENITTLTELYRTQKLEKRKQDSGAREVLDRE